MFVQKKKYYLFIENTREFNLKLIKKRNKFIIIYRNQNIKEKIDALINFRKNCKKHGVDLYIANNTYLLSKIKADGLYISAYNKKLSLNLYAKVGYKIIGSAHNKREIDIKVKQGCKKIIYSRIFETKNKFKKGYLGLQRFNILSINSPLELIPLGGINHRNLNKMNFVRSNAFACLSVIKKKPAKFINRLF
tara:strand:+ start:77 stop:652 length:576 start_codon:yes stop_codon:yes gene_type:complete